MELERKGVKGQGVGGLCAVLKVCLGLFVWLWKGVMRGLGLRWGRLLIPLSPLGFNALGCFAECGGSVRRGLGELDH